MQISTLIQETEVHSKHLQAVKPTWWDSVMKRYSHSFSEKLSLWETLSYIAHNDSQFTDGAGDKNPQLKDYGKKIS